MNVYKIRFDWSIRSFAPNLSEERRMRIDEGFGLGRSVSSDWDPFTLVHILNDDQKLDPIGDFFTVFMRAVIGVTPQALGVEGAKESLLQCGEILPVEYERETFWLLNCLNVVDALDPIQSDIVVCDNGHRYAWEMVFKRDLSISEWLFCVPESCANTFATQHFVDFYREHQMTGLIFIPQKTAS
ncbi:MAG: hypothetical protein U1F71_04770 [Verrucomicrobiaceae bacterium]